MLGKKDADNVAVWLALGKVFLAAGLIVFTIVAMSGGNPANEYVISIIPSINVTIPGYN